jgi:hypothetical protein
LLAANVVYCCAQKGGSKDASGKKKGIQGKAQNGKVAAVAAAAPRAKRPGLSQSASFPARGTAGAKKAAAAVTALPKQARPEGKGAVPNGSAAAAGSFWACYHQVDCDGCCWVYLQNWDGIAGRGTEKKANSAQVPAARRSMVATHSHFVNYWIFSCIVLNLVSFFFGLACEA